MAIVTGASKGIGTGIATALAAGSNPNAIFSFLSGSGADQSGRSRLAFARYKGRAEKALLRPVSLAFTFFGPHTSIPWSCGKNPISPSG